MPIRSRLPAVMEKYEITYEELQHRANVSADTIARARDNRIATCQLLTLEKIANALQVNVHELFEHDTKPHILKV